MPECYQVNFQGAAGGGEIYTRFFTDALVSLGWNTTLVVWSEARFWEGMRLSARRVSLSSANDLCDALPRDRALLLTHNVLGPELASRVAGRHALAGVVHMPYYGRAAGGLSHYHRLLAVSRHVRDSLFALGLSDTVYSEPLYGVADLRPRAEQRPTGISSGRLYDWDRRKFRDRLLSLGQPLTERLSAAKPFRRRDGVTIGIVSRLTPIKQFPLMFSLLAPVLARAPGVNLEIFGSGAYASVRDLKRSLAPLGERCRFWGEQPDVAAVYRQLDFVLSGLPEKEALGLNLLEAQAAGIPVLAVNAPPFTETVLDGVTGHLFADPRLDQGRDFERLLARILAGAAVLDRSRAASHLALFSEGAFRSRVAGAMQSLEEIAHAG